jgi:hypothetical protein
MNNNRGRVTLTKAQLASRAGADLVVLCQNMTEDGHIDNQEVLDLIRWLERYRDEDIPAIGFLVETVNHIMADGIITERERSDLQKAVERVLPSDLRQGAASRRREAELAKVREIERESAARERRKADEQARLKQMVQAGEIAAVDMNFRVAGCSHHNREALIRRFAQRGNPVFLVREYGNTYSKNAIAIFLQNGSMIGYVPEYYAAEWAGYLDRGYKQLAYIRDFHLIEAINVPYPIIEGGLYVPISTFPGAVLISPAPPPSSRTAPHPYPIPSVQTVIRPTVSTQTSVEPRNPFKDGWALWIAVIILATSLCLAVVSC